MFKFLFFMLMMFVNSYNIVAQDNRIQYPRVLKDSYFGLNIGYINYPFSSSQLKAGNTVASIRVPHTAVRIILLGHEFNKNLSAQISYMRPVDWVEYRNINGDSLTHTVWMNVTGLTVAAKIPLGKKISLFAEGGLGLIMRKGFEINNIPVVANASYATGLFGSSLQYHIDKKWDVQLNTTWSPQHKTDNQPHTIFYSAGFNYHLKQLSDEKVKRNIKSGYYFPRQFIQAGYTTNALGYSINNLFSKKFPIFWGGAAHIKEGVSVNYQRNIFHARKVFSLDWGAGMGYWESKNKQDKFFTMSLYPVLRFTAIRTKNTSLFFEYSVAGPTFISKTIIDNEKTGKKFTFQDFMGMGIFTGRKKNLNAGLRIAHYSNGNLFPENNGVKIPLTFILGYVLK